MQTRGHDTATLKWYNDPPRHPQSPPYFARNRVSGWQFPAKYGILPVVRHQAAGRRPRFALRSAACGCVSDALVHSLSNGGVSMADTKAPRGQQPLPRKPEPRLAHSPANPLDAEDLARRRQASARCRQDARHKSWFQRNRSSGHGHGGGRTGAGAAGGLRVAVRLVWRRGQARPPVAAAPQGTPAQPPRRREPPRRRRRRRRSPGTMPGVTPQPGQPLPPGQTAKQEPAKDKPPQEQKPPLTDDFTKWKRAGLVPRPAGEPSQAPRGHRLPRQREVCRQCARWPRD